MDKCLLSFAGRLGRCWTELVSPLPKTNATLILTITVILLICVGLGFLVFALAEGGHIPSENEGAGLAISGACAFTIVFIFSILWCYKLQSKRRNSAAEVPLREQSRTAINDTTFIEVISEPNSAGPRTPMSTESSEGPEVASIVCGKESSKGSCDQLAEVEVHNESFQKVVSESDKQEQQVASSQENKLEEEPVSADEQIALKSDQQQEPLADTTFVI